MHFFSDIFINGFLFVFLFFLIGVLITALVSLYVRVPFVPTNRDTLDTVLEVLPKMLPKDSCIYELGCGEGRIVSALAKKYPTHQVFGYEIAPLIAYMAKWNTRKDKNADICMKNFFHHHIEKGSLVVLYLLPSVLEKTWKKLQNELLDGASVFSIGFAIPGVSPNIIISANGKSSKIFVYYLNKEKLTKNREKR